MTTAQVRLLGPPDASAWLELRLRGLREHPRAFLASLAEDAARELAHYEERLAADPAVACVLGAFEPDERGTPILLGTVGVYREPREKTRYKAGIWGMYVAREAQGRGLGHALIEAAITKARAMGVEKVCLCVDAANEAARELYLSHGFVTTSVDAFRADGESVDEERMSLTL